MTEQVVLVNTSGEAIGAMEKMHAHQLGELHSAFSVFIFNAAGQMLLQQRALNKYHSGGKWTNTCCSHPRPGEDLKSAAQRRLMEEMGMACELQYLFDFIYRAELDNDLIEHEYDYVFVGFSNTLPVPVPAEVADYQYISIEDLEEKLNSDPERFTAWLKICFKQLKVNLIRFKSYKD